jgi:hypothetical protein
LVSKAYSYTKVLLAGKEDAERREILREAVLNSRSKSYDGELAAGVLPYGRRLKSLLKARRTGLDTLWKRIKASCLRPIPLIQPRKTSVKRGLAKLLIFEPADRTKIYKFFETGDEIDGLPGYALVLALAQEEVGFGKHVPWSITDSDIKDALYMLQGIFGRGKLEEECEQIFARCPVERMEMLYINPLRHCANVAAFNQYVLDHYDTLITREGMTRALSTCFDDPMILLLNYPTVGNEGTVWLFQTLLALFKAVGGTKQSYGLSTLADDSGVPDVDAGGFLVPPFVAREKAFSDDVLRKISNALATRLRGCSRETLADQLLVSKAYYIQPLIETQLIPYRDFDPIGCVIKDVVASADIGHASRRAFRTCASEFAATPSGGTTKALEIDCDPPALILWQSANRNARDKAKEFAARVACLRSRFDKTKKQFVDRGYRIFMVN